MSKHWVYVLKNVNEYSSDEELQTNGIKSYCDYYIGETTRLYRRWSEHLSGNGAINTHYFDNVVLIGLYNIKENLAFADYDKQVKYYNDFEINNFTYQNWNDRDINDGENLEIENIITEIFILNSNENYNNIKGGKYTKELSENTYNNLLKNKNYIIDRPNCKCGYPCEVFLSKKNDIWFKCPISNTDWIKFKHPNFEIADNCDFIQKYKKDEIYKHKYNDFIEKESDICILNIPKLEYKNGSETNWKQNMNCTICNNEKYNPIFNKGFRALCKECLISNFDKVKGYKKQTYDFIDDSD